MTKWTEIKKDWENSKMTYKELERKHGVKATTIKSRKHREKWEREDDGSVRTGPKNVAEPTPIEETSLLDADLTERQKLFVINYIKYTNATKAYQEAYGAGYNTAATNAHNLLKNPKVKKHVQRLQKERMNSALVGVDAVLQKYIDIAFADMTDYVEFGTEDATYINDYGDEEEYKRSYVRLKDSSEVDGTLITEVKQGRDGVSIKLADKMKALEKLVEYVDMMQEGRKKALQEERMRIDNERAREELKYLQGDDSDDAHERMKQYMNAVGAKNVKDVFDDEK